MFRSINPGRQFFCGGQKPNSMGIILNSTDLSRLTEQKHKGVKIVLAGGCFDILHAGHIQFLQNAKKQGDSLVVFLESDEKIREIKGPNRPINSQADRAAVIANLRMVDFVVCLPRLKNDLDYEILVKRIEPGIIAITAGNTIYDWERNYASSVGAKIVEVIERKEEYSTTKITQKIKI